MDTHTSSADSNYTQARLQRLVNLHLAGAPVAAVGQRVLNPWLLERLIHCVLTEGYGQ